ncbi:MAG: hypothetical protein LC105_04270 [Chitinophagales bacterium]|nr:hypothetical protein [Chitinophagales bacterium]
MKGYAIQLERDEHLEKVLKPVFHIVRDDKGKIISGLQLGPTQAQNEALILVSNPGEYKNSPTLGVGLEDALLTETDLLEYRHKVRKDYDLEGLEILELDMYRWDKISIKAKYKV